MGVALSALLGLLGTAVGVWFKYVRKPPDPAAEVAKVDHAELDAAVNDRPDPRDVAGRLRRGDF